MRRVRIHLTAHARAQLAEFGIAIAQGPRNILNALQRLDRDEAMSGLPDLLRATLQVFASQLESLSAGIRTLARQLIAWHRADPTSQRLETIPGVGILTATALAASIENQKVFRLGRDLAAFLGLVPRQNSTGGKSRLGAISRMGNGYLRRLLVVGATSVVRRAAKNDTSTGPWLRGLLSRKPARLVTVAVANKTARIAWRSWRAAARIRPTSAPDPIRPTRTGRCDAGTEGRMRIER